MSELLKTANLEATLQDPGVAHIAIDRNKVVSSKEIPGLEAELDEHAEGVRLRLVVKEGTVIEKPTHLCFGILAEEAVQKIDLDFTVERNASIAVLAHCVFPAAREVQHIMDGRIKLEDGASYSYLEKHIHSEYGGTQVYPKARIEMGSNARFTTEFELLQGRVGVIDIDYETSVGAESTVDMTARVNGSGDDVIKINETAYLLGQGATGVLNSRVAVRQDARAEIYNKVIAEAPFARGHVDCKEIVQGNGTASAIPIVEVKDPRAHITHEAAIGSVDSKQLQTLMSRGLSEEQAVELIIDGLLS